MNILLTGGAGYIGSHAAVVLAQAGHGLVLYDNLCNSRREVAQRAAQIAGRSVPLIEGDVRAFEFVSGRAVPCDMVRRRSGDVATSCASADRARELPRWQARRSLQEMCAGTWRWQQNCEKLTT